MRSRSIFGAVTGMWSGRPSARALNAAVTSNRVILAALALMCALVTAAVALGTVLVTDMYLMPIRVPQAEQLVMVREIKADQKEATGWPVTTATASRWQESFSALTEQGAMTASTRRVVRFGRYADVVRTREASPEFFELLRATPIAGTLSGSATDQAFISESLVVAGREMSAQDVGATILIDDVPHTVGGLFPRSVSDSIWFGQAEIILPLKPSQSITERRITVIGRLRPDRSLRSAQDELDSLSSRLQQSLPDSYTGWYGRVTQVIHDARDFSSETLGILIVLLGAMALLSVANVACLIRVRALSGLRDIAVRTAMGASRGSAVAPLIWEISVAATAGSIAGVWLATVAAQSVADLSNRQVTAVFANLQPSIVVSVTVAVALNLLVLCAVVFAARRVLWSSIDTSTVLRSHGRLYGAPFRYAVVIQSAAAVVLMSAAAAFFLSLSRLEAADLGFQAEKIMTARLNRRPGLFSPATSHLFADSFVAELTKLPQVAGVCLASTIPFGGVGTGNYLGPADMKGGPGTSTTIISPGCFGVFGVAMLGGRDFTTEDRPGSPPVAIASRGLSQKIFANDAAVGQGLIVLGEPMQASAIAVKAGDRHLVGVFADVTHYNVSFGKTDEVYVPLAQNPVRNLYVALKTRNDPALVINDIRRILEGLEPGAPLYDVQSMDQRVAAIYRRPRSLAAASIVIALAALAISLVGLYGIASFAAARQASELAVRAALGASPVQVRRLLMMRSVRYSAVGAAAGLAVVVIAYRGLASTFYGVSATDGYVAVVAAALSVSIAGLAALPSAVRVSLNSPAATLRQQT